MDHIARERLYGERSTWLNEGRGALIGELLRQCPNIEGDVLEVGAGSGLYVDIMASYGPLDVIEVDEETCDALEQHDAVRTSYRVGIPELQTDRRYGLIGAFDVLEHIESDSSALQWVSDHLTDNGVFIATVPAYQWLYSDHDRAVYHFRRYTERTLRQAFPPSLRIQTLTYFNTTLFPVAVAARAAWQVKRKFTNSDGKIAKQSSELPKAVDTLFLSIMKGEIAAIRSGMHLPFGISIVVLARKQAIQ